MSTNETQDSVLQSALHGVENRTVQTTIPDTLGQPFRRDGRGNLVSLQLRASLRHVGQVFSVSFNWILFQGFGFLAWALSYLDSWAGFSGCG